MTGETLTDDKYINLEGFAFFSLINRQIKSIKRRLQIMRRMPTNEQIDKIDQAYSLAETNEQDIGTLDGQVAELEKKVTTVEANPTASGTEDLTKLKVGDTVYNVSGGGGAGYTKTEADSTFIKQDNGKFKNISIEIPTSTNKLEIGQQSTTPYIKMNGGTIEVSQSSEKATIYPARISLSKNFDGTSYYRDYVLFSAYLKPERVIRFPKDKAGTFALIEDLPQSIELTGAQGTLTDEQYNTLTASNNNYIILEDEIYYLQDKRDTSGTRVYSHVGLDTVNNFFIKCISLTISTKAWSLHSKQVQ